MNSWRNFGKRRKWYEERVLEAERLGCYRRQGNFKLFLLKRPDEDIKYLNWMENTALTELISDKESHTYQLIRLNDYSHLRELRTLGYEKWGLFAARDYWAKQPNFSFPGDLQQMQEPACL